MDVRNAPPLASSNSIRARSAVELQILKHLKRDARPTVSVIDGYCSAYNYLFPEVRSYECFKYLHQGLISPIITKVITRNSQGSGNIFTPIASSLHSKFTLVSKRIETEKIKVDN